MEYVGHTNNLGINLALNYFLAHMHALCEID